MDTALIVTLVVSILGNIAAWWQLWNQGKKDKLEGELEKNRQDLDKDTATQEAALTMIQTLQGENDRLRARGIELENTVIAKTTEVGELKLAAIDKETEIRTMKYEMEGLKMKLNAIYKEKPPKKIVLPSEIKSANKEDQKRKAMVSKNINLELSKIKNDSLFKGE